LCKHHKPGSSRKYLNYYKIFLKIPLKASNQIIVKSFYFKGASKNIKILPFLCFQYTEADVATFRNVGVEHLGDKSDERWLQGIVFGEFQRHLEDPILKLSKFLV
jgi:hypothetical protein